MTSPSSIRGTILRVPDTQPGLIHADGQQLAFQLEGVWKSTVAPAVNQVVDIERDEQGQITSLTVVQSSQLAAEKVRQAAGQLGERGKKAAEAAREWAQGPGREKLGQASTAAVQHGQKAYGSFKAWAMSKPAIAKNPKAWAIGAVAVLVAALALMFNKSPEQRFLTLLESFGQQIEKDVEPPLNELFEKLRSVDGPADFRSKRTDLVRSGNRVLDRVEALLPIMREMAELSREIPEDARKALGEKHMDQMMRFQRMGERISREGESAMRSLIMNAPDAWEVVETEFKDRMEKLGRDFERASSAFN